MNKRLTAGAVALAALLPGPAPAQEVLHAPEAVRACLCRDRTVVALALAVRQDDEAFDLRQKELRDLDTRIDAARRTLDPNDPAGRAALGRLLLERDGARDRFAAQVTPRHNAIIDRYNAAVAAYAQDCGGKAYDADVLAHVRDGLACPPET